ncbi:hybrid signal transduction histidine kinase M [Artemisia annua]|uniref:Hybrid signal transduction histidine kinase M n=1 Tax=Artemisia annua TaxID=35608 RepID=A0A2U1KJ94_ARTAN|nr:hybrid signal transduction histidine kinase M [Artemisia annua]
MAGDDVADVTNTPPSPQKLGTSQTDPEWNKQDDLVKVWILGTLNESLQDQVVTTPENAKALWDHIKDLFHSNKDARAITLDSELRSVKIGNLSINAYCKKIQGMVDRLHNLGEKVNDKNMVLYAINGLDDLFKGIVRIIRHREPLPTFETARNMLLLEEATFNASPGKTSSFNSSSSSPTILMTTKTNNKGNLTKPQSLPQMCNHFNKGSCKFGERCKFIHDHRNRAGLQSKNNNGSNIGRPSVNSNIGQNYVNWVPPAQLCSTTAQSAQWTSWTRTRVLPVSGYVSTKCV